MTHYRHTQVGWQVYAVLIPVTLVVVYMVVTHDPGEFAVLLTILLLVFAVFGWLTVDIDVERLRIAFGIGLVRRSISLRTIRAFAPVRNRWYYGWGIRLTPHGILYNVSGLNAVELLLEDGRRVRVGTDEPDALVRALAGATRMTATPSVDEFPKDVTWRRRVRLISVAMVALVSAIVLGQCYVYSREPSVDLTSETLSVGAGFHGTEIPLSAIQTVTLVDTLPRIQRRTNGFAAGGLLRGNFRLDEWGFGRLFINRTSPPYVVVRTRDTFVVVNFEDAARTRALYEQLRNAAERP
ncbi:MAG: hypothetical protein EHM55_07185 [Acidobacteria bacterium]|nr:MAG: hypothetical protein EHM55_07185 [Acidobacteriota bacterium]